MNAILGAGTSARDFSLRSGIIFTFVTPNLSTFSSIECFAASVPSTAIIVPSLAFIAASITMLSPLTAVSCSSIPSRLMITALISFPT